MLTGEHVKIGVPWSDVISRSAVDALNIKRDGQSD